MGLADNRSIPLLMAPTGSPPERSKMRYLWVGLGGACGTIARYAIALRVDQSAFPWATLGINVGGAFALGLLLTIGLGQFPVAVMAPIAVGVIGGFTTFSTFAWESYTLERGGRPGVALLYVVVSVIGGLLAAAAGHAMGRAFR
jgi:CrcB protein